MSFIPSFLKSVPQLVSFSGATIAVPATQLITAVDLTVAVILATGTNGSEGGGFDNGANHNYLDFSDATHVRATTAITPTAAAVIVKGIILEFVKALLLQNVYWNTVDILNGQVSGTVNTGLTLGPKAFLVPAGFWANYNTAASINEGAIIPAISLNVATGVVTCTRGAADAFQIRHSFFIVDPR